MATLTCYKCKTEKIATEFNKNQKKCRTCEKEYNKTRKEKIQAEIAAPDATKQCIKCNENLLLNKFTSGKNTCRECINKYERERKAAHREQNPKPIRLPLFPHVEIDQEKPKPQELTAGQIEYQKRKEYWVQARKRYYAENKEKVKEYSEGYKERRNALLRERRQKDRFFAAKNSMRVRLSRVLQGKKDDTFDKYLGCTSKELRKWISHQFTEDMSWSNYAYAWHIDHVVPIQFFDLKNVLERDACFHWSNLKPLKKEDNMSKSDKILLDYIIDHQKCVKAYMCSEYQTVYENTWWPRLELGYGKNLTDEKGSEELLKWAIRNQASNPAIDKGIEEGSTT